MDQTKRSDREGDDDAPFTLARQSVKGKKRETFETEPTRQGVLFAGADCLAGQLDLWNPDGRDDDARP